MINYANPQGVGATAMPGAVNQQRNAITQALMNVQNPPPRTNMPPGPMGVTNPAMAPRPPASLGGSMPDPMAPANAAGVMPGQQPAGILGQSGIAPAPIAGSAVPPVPGMGMGGPGAITPATGAPMGPQPNTGSLLNRQPLLQDPQQQLMPPGMQPQSY